MREEIEIGKVYELYDGRKVKIVSTSVRHPRYPVLGLVQGDEGEFPETFTPEGYNMIAKVNEDEPLGPRITGWPLSTRGHRTPRPGDIKLKEVLDVAYSSLVISEDGKTIVRVIPELRALDKSMHKQFAGIVVESSDPESAPEGYYSCFWEKKAFTHYNPC